MPSYLPFGHLHPAASAAFVYGTTAVLVGLVLVAVRRAWRSSRERARAALSEGAAPDHDSIPDLEEGASVVVGVVEYAANADSAVTVEVEQAGVEEEVSGDWQHRWEETDRRVRANPFYLRLVSGVRVRVEATPSVLLVDDMDRCIPVDGARRVRVAELAAGDRVIARGHLRRDFDPEGAPGGYRDSPGGWVLTAPHGGDLFLSSEPLEHRFDRAGRLHRRAATALLGVLALASLLSANYYRRSWFGETTDAELTSKRQYDDIVDDTYVTVHEVTLQLPSGGRLVGKLSSASAWESLRPGSLVPVRHVDGAAAQIGRLPTVGVVHVAFLLLFAVASWFLYALTIRRATPWYAGTVVDRGEGRLRGDTGLDDARHERKR